MAQITDIKTGATAEPLPDVQEPTPKAEVRSPSSLPTDLYGRIDPYLRRISALRKRPLLVLVSSFIDNDTCTKLFDWRREMRHSGQTPLDVLIHSPGGDLSACYQIGRLLSRWAPTWDALVPSLAASGATLICLGSEQVVMSEIAHLGPLDPQVISKRRGKFFAVERQSPLEAFQAIRYLRQFSLESLDTTMKFLLENMITPQHALDTAAKLSTQLVQPILDQIDPYDVGAFSLDSHVSSGCCQRLSRPADAEKKTQRTARYQVLVEQYPAHEFIVDLDEARAIGFNACEAAGELDELFCSVRAELLADENKPFECVGVVPSGEEGK